MGKAAAKRQTTTAKPLVDQRMEQFASATAKQQFLGATMNMGWRLAITVVIPLVAGVKLDDHFHTAPSWTLLGLFVAAAAGCSAVWKTIQEVNAAQAVPNTTVKKEKSRG